MWRSKMAARWRGKDGDLNVDNGDFLATSISNEFVLSRGDAEDVHMDTQSCTDPSILAIFEDPTVPSEGRSGVEENEKLLSALSEMLDSVEDDDGTLSPFDVLPDTTFLNQPQHSDNSVVVSLSDRPRQRPKSANVTLTPKSDGEKEDKNGVPQLFTQQSQTLLHSNEVEVFTSTSLVNLVRLMHPYCLKLHVEEGGKLRDNHALFSKEEVWRYERPTEEVDEEINVVSDDEEPVKEAKGKEAGDGKRDDGKLPKSALLNGKWPRAAACREKKRVSFGPVQVASFDEPVATALNGRNPTGEALPAPRSSAEAVDADARPPKGETKAKSLSLQQYRQLRQKRQPLVEKQGSYTTKWPSVSEPPKELTPILGLQGQRRNSCGPETAHHCLAHPRVSADHLHNPAPKATPSHHASPPPKVSRPQERSSTHLKPPRAETKIISPDSPLPDTTTTTTVPVPVPSVNVPESKKSPVKKAPLLSSDPPNPVLLPLPPSRAESPSTALSPSLPKLESLNVDSELRSTSRLQSAQHESSAASPQRQTSSSEPKPRVSLVKQTDDTLLQEMNKKFTEVPSHASRRPPALYPPPTRPESASRCNKPQPQKRSLSPTEGAEREPRAPQSGGPDPERHVKCPSSTPCSTRPLKEEVAPEPPTDVSSPQEPPSPLQVGCRGQRAASDSGIEAPDLTSLLEQFEETQAKEDDSAAPPSNGGNCTGSEKTSGSPPAPSEAPGTLKDLPRHLQTSERVDIPEALGTEIILGAQQPARRKNPPPKAIQIIDPRPLPPRRTHISPSEPPAAHSSPHVYSAVPSDHDYCGPVGHSLVSAAERSRVRPSPLKDTPKLTSDSQVTSVDSSAAAAARITEPSPGRAEPAARRQSEKDKPGTNPPADRALQFSGHSAAAGDVGASEGKTAPCTLPTPPPSPVRGRQKRRYRRRSPRPDSSSSSSSSSDSDSSSASRSPKRQKLHRRRSESSSCSSSPCRSMSRSPPRRYSLPYSRSRCSRSRSRSWSQSRSPSRSRSPSPQICHRRWKDVYSSRESRRLRREHEMRIQKLKAIDERRVVYVGRIRSAMTHDELRERFSQFGEVECVSLHFRDRGDHYGFVTFYNMEDAFAAIDNGGKLRKPDELPFDICFGGRRQFCSSNYADLDANRDADPPPPRSRFEDLDFDSLLQQAQRGLKR